jgi:hypothetical protein
MSLFFYVGTGIFVRRVMRTASPWINWRHLSHLARPIAQRESLRAVGSNLCFAASCKFNDGKRLSHSIVRLAVARGLLQVRGAFGTSLAKGRVTMPDGVIKVTKERIMRKGTREEIQQDIEDETDLPVNERGHLLRALGIHNRAVPLAMPELWVLPDGRVILEVPEGSEPEDAEREPAF